MQPAQNTQEMNSPPAATAAGAGRIRTTLTSQVLYDNLDAITRGSMVEYGRMLSSGDTALAMVAMDALEAVAATIALPASDGARARLAAEACALLAELLGEERVAMDVAHEGPFGRTGQVTTVSLGTDAGGVHEIDLQGRAVDDPVVVALRGLLESGRTVKVVHGCQMKADLLEHRLGITLAGVYDTQLAHELRTGQQSAAYKAVLLHNQVSTGGQTDARAVLLTKLVVAGHQVADLGAKAGFEASVLDETARKMAFACGAKVHEVRANSPGAFIGGGGSKLRRLEKRSRTVLSGKGEGPSKTFLVYSNEDSDLSVLDNISTRVQPAAPDGAAVAGVQ